LLDQDRSYVRDEGAETVESNGTNVVGTYATELVVEMAVSQVELGGDLDSW